MRDNTVQIPQHVNGWEDCGNDGLMYWKDRGNRVFSFISREWLGGSKDENGNELYAICEDDIDLKEMSLHDIELAICGSWSSIEEMEKATGCKLGELDETIAQEAFDNRICDTISWQGTFTLAEANQKIFEHMLREV